MSRRFTPAIPLALGVLSLVVLALSAPSSAAGPRPARAFVALSTRVFAGRSTPAPLQHWAAPAVCPAGPQARYCTDLVRNGGFETGSFMYWDTTGSPVVLIA